MEAWARQHLVITVVIPTRKRARLLAEALASLAAQTFTDFEVVIVNDGGPSLEAVLGPWLPRLNVILIELPAQCGVSHARNMAIERANGEFLAFLDDDDIFLPNHLAAAHDALRHQLDFVYLGALVSGRRLRELPPDYSTMPVKAYEFDNEFILVANYIHTGSVVVRNFRGENVRFDETLTHCEDWEMWIALSRGLRFRTGHVSELSSIYHQLPESGGLVAAAQQTVPSPFTVARERVHALWPSTNTRVVLFRDWMTEFERHRNDCIRRGLRIPYQLFDPVLRDLHDWFVTGSEPDYALIPEYFRFRSPQSRRPVLQAAIE